MKSFKSFLVEAMDREYRRELARERRTEREREAKRPGVKSHSPGLNAKKTAADYAKSQMGSIKLHDKVTKKSGHTVGNPFPEEYQPEVEEKKKPKRAPMGGDAAKPGPNKNYVKPMGESTVVHKMGGVVMGKTQTADGKNTVKVDDAPVSKSTYDFMQKTGMNKVDSSGKPTPDTTYDERKAAGLKTVKKVEEAAEKDHEYSMARSEIKTLQNAAKRLQKKMGKKGEGNLEAWVQSKITKAADYIDTAADYVTNEAAGEKDACYKKVKRRFKVWPSAYASGALVQCRKKGADNWGSNKKK